MARIRTIKPEFPQSESIGKLSRDARLLFIQIWTIVDDSGRSRASSRLLASLLYPYDEDAPSLIGGWIEELDREQCIVRYKINNQYYLQVLNWNKHQKIDKPTPSKIPPFVESSRVLAESSPSPRGGIGLEGKGRERKEEDTCASYSTDIPEVSDEEAHAPIPEPVQEEREPGSYPQAVFAAWEALGAHVYQPSSLWLFESKWGQHVAPYVKGIHSSDVLKALANFRSIVDAPEGTYYWTQRIGAHAFFEKHLEKFLPANFDPKDFEKRLNFKEQEEADTKAAYREVFGQEMET